MPGERATDFRFRLRFAAAVTLIAAVPLAIAAWAVGRLVAGHEVDKADSSLVASASVATGYMGQRLQGAAVRADVVARAPAVQRAFANREAGALRRFARDHPRIRFRLGGVSVGALPARHRALRSSSTVTVAGRRIGQVIVIVPLRSAVRKAAFNAGIEWPNRLIAMAAGRLKPSEPTDIKPAGVSYRAVATRPIQGVILVSLTPRDPIDAAASRARWRAAWAALATLATVALLAYLLAPLARRRLRWDLGELTEVEEAPADDATGRPRSARDELGVIVIDDDPSERDLISSALAPSRFHVLHVADADRALEVLAAERPQLAILDWKLAGRGAELLAELNIRHPDLRVLVVADELAPQQRHVASLLGARDFLVRPLTGDNVAAKVRTMLDGARGTAA
jgi:CheY-like chemotaxis protein